MSKQSSGHFKVIFGLIIAVIIAIFAVLNSKAVEINLAFTSFMVSQSVVILVSVTLGALLMYIVNVYYSLKSKRTKKMLDKEIEKEKKKVLEEAEKTKNEDVKSNLALDNSPSRPVDFGEADSSIDKISDLDAEPTLEISENDKK